MHKKNSSKKSAEQYKKMYKALKPFITEKMDLRKPLSSSQKSFITKYHNELERLTRGKPYALQFYRSQNAKRLKAAQELGGQNTKLTKFKVAFIPKTSTHQKIRFDKNGQPHVVTKYVDAHYIKLDAEKMIEAEDIAEYINDLIADVKSKTFGIQAGDYEISYTASKSKIGQEVAKLCGQYSNPDENNFYGNWMGGLFAYNFQNQSELNSYRDSKRAAQLKKDRATKKRNNKKRIKLYYWYDRKAQTVLLTKTPDRPNKHCEEITESEYHRFFKTGEI